MYHSLLYIPFHVFTYQRNVPEWTWGTTQAAVFTMFFCCPVISLIGLIFAIHAYTDHKVAHLFSLCFFSLFFFFIFHFTLSLRKIIAKKFRVRTATICRRRRKMLKICKRYDMGAASMG